MDHQWSQPPTSNVRWLPHSSALSISSRGPNVQRTASMPTVSASQPLQPPIVMTPHETIDLHADMKKVLEHVVASHEEQKKMSKGVDELAAKVKVLERVLCGDVGCPRKNMDPVIVQKGGLVQQLTNMDAAIDNLLDLVTCLKTDRSSPPVHHDASVSACVPSPSGRNRYVYDPADLPETLPLSLTEMLRPSLRFSSHSVNWNANPPNSRRVSLLGFSSHESDHFSSLATPSPDRPHGETFGRANDKVSPRSLASLQTGLGCLDQNSSTTSPSHTSSSLSSLTTSSSVEVTHTANSYIPPKFNSRTSTLTTKTAPSQLTQTAGTTPSQYTSPVPVSSYSTSTSPTRTPNSALSRARAASLSRILSGVQPDTEGGMDCEGLCADCKAERVVQQERQDQIMDSPSPQSPIGDFRGQNAGDRTRISSDMSIGELHSPLQSAEEDANAEASLPVLGAVLGVESMAPHAQPVSRTSSNGASRAAAMEDDDVEPCSPGSIWSREVSDVAGEFHVTDPDEGMQLGHVGDAGVSGTVRLDNRHELRHRDAGEYLAEAGLQIGSEDEDLDGSLNEYVESADENYAAAFVPNTGNPSQQSVKDRYQVCPSERPELSLTDSEDFLQLDDIHAKSCQPIPSDPRFDADHLNQYLSSAEHSRELTPADSLLQDEEAVAAALAAVSDSPEEASTLPPTSPVTTINLPYVSSSSSPSSELRSLSPLSSLPESPPQLEKESSDGSRKQNGKRVVLRRTESLHSEGELGTCGAFSGSSRFAVQNATMLGSTSLHKSDASLALRGGPKASLEELSVLARRNPPKLNIRLSDLKRKLEVSGCTIKQVEKRTKFGSGAYKGMDTASSSCANIARELNAEDPAGQSAGSSTSMQDVTSLRVESVSVPIGARSASGSRPAAITKTTRMAASARELPVDSTQVPKNRVRVASQKAKESVTQKGRQPRRNASRGSSKRAPRRRKSKSLSSQDDGQICQWPAKIEQEGLLQRQFVQCDNCHLWYHFGCVGIVEGDSRLEPEAAFICPPCCVSTAKRQTLRNRDEVCARPDCLHANLEVQEFVIERLVGRKPVGQAGHLYLVKWEGYPITQATWTPGGNLDGASQVFDQFLVDAKAEGIDIQAKGVVLLEEARVGGWEV